MRVSNKKNLYVADEDLVWFEKAKELFPDVSASKLIAGLLRERCLQREGELQRMEECTVYQGSYDPGLDVFIGREFRFYGVKIATGYDAYGTEITVYLTKKGKFLVYSETKADGKVLMGFDDPFEGYGELSGKIPAEMLDMCSKYLNKNSDIRSYELLDI